MKAIFAVFIFLSIISLSIADEDDLRETVRRLDAQDQCWEKFVILEELFDTAINSRNPASPQFIDAIDQLYLNVLTPDFAGSIAPGNGVNITFSNRAEVTSATAFLATRVFLYRRAIAEYPIWNTYTQTHGVRKFEVFFRISQFFTNTTGFYYSDNFANDECVEYAPGDFRYSIGNVANSAIFRSECASATCGGR